MRISARNNFKGQISKIVHGVVGAEVTIQLANGLEIVAVITETSAKDMALREGMQVHAIVKASSVMIATD